MIPARLNSKRIPKKNIRYLGNKPLIQYAIELAGNENRFESIWINTESKELSVIAGKMGINYHPRPPYLAGDTVTNREFTYEFLQKHDCDYVIMVNTTSPLIRQRTMSQFIDFVENYDFDTVLSVIAEKEEIFFKGKPLNFTFNKKVNSQLLEPIEKVCWALTAWKKETFMKLQERGENPVFGGLIGKFLIPKDESCDLDTIEDWNIAEGIIASRINQFEERYIEI